MNLMTRCLGTALTCAGLNQAVADEGTLRRPSSTLETKFSYLLMGQRLEPMAGALPDSQGPDAGEAKPGLPPESQEPAPVERADWSQPARGPWALDAGVAVISDNSTHGLFAGQANDADGDEGGLIYNFYASYLLKEFELERAGRTLRPHLEFRGGLGVVDQHSGSTFMNYMTDMTLRWRDFPWNRYVDTSIGVGGGFWYSEKVLAIDRKRHEGEDRSHLKFFLPIELTLACPKYPLPQLYLFNHHASGGHIFDEGGIDTWGGGVRFRLP